MVAAVFFMGPSWALESANRAAEDEDVCPKEAHCTRSNTPMSTVDDSHQPSCRFSLGVCKQEVGKPGSFSHKEE